MPRQPGRDGSVERGDGVAVHRGGDGLAVDDLGDGLSDGDLVERRSAGLEDEVVDLGALADDNLHAALGTVVPQVLDIGDGQAPVGDHDLALLDRLLERRLGLVELQDHAAVADLAVTGVALVDAQPDLLRGVEGLHRVRTGADDLVVRLQRVRRVGHRDDRGGGRGEDVGEGGVRICQVEGHGELVRRLHLLDPGEQLPAVRLVLDGQLPLDGVPDVLSGQRRAVGEGEPVAQGAGVGDVVLPVAGLRGVRLRVGLAEGHRQQPLVGVVDDVPRGLVVGARGVDVGHRVGGADDHRQGGVAAGGRLGVGVTSVAVPAVPGAGGEEECPRDRERRCRCRPTPTHCVPRCVRPVRERRRWL